MKVQLRLKTEQTFEQYVSGQGWERATIEACPFHPEGGCGLAGHGRYMRKLPAVAWVERWYCPRAGATIGLLPDFYASRMPGTLDALEETVAQAEQAESIEKAAQQARPAEASDAVTLPTAVRWVRLRVELVTVVLVAALGMFPDRFGPTATPTVAHVRQQLGVPRALVALRTIADGRLHELPRPLGLVPPRRKRSDQQSSGSDVPDPSG